MKFEDLTVEKIKEMSQEDLFHWGEIFAKIQQAKQIRKILINYIEIKESGDVVKVVS